MERVDPYATEENKLFERVWKDTNHCTVVTLSVVTGWTLDEAHYYLETYGRYRRKGLTNKQITEAMSGLRYNNFKVVKGEYSNTNRITVNQFVKKHPVGTYYCTHRGHAFAIKDGVIYDHTEGKRREIKLAFRVVKGEDYVE